MAEDEGEDEGVIEGLEETASGGLFRLIVFVVVLAFVAAVGIAMILGIPIIRALLGHEIPSSSVSARVVRPLTLVASDATSCSATDIACQMGAILNAVIGGIVSVISASFQGVVQIGNTIVAVIGAFLTAIFMAPISFFSAAWNTATGSLAQFGIGAPVAMVIVIGTTLAIVGVLGFLIVRGIRESASVAED